MNDFSRDIQVFLRLCPVPVVLANQLPHEYVARHECFQTGLQRYVRACAKVFHPHAFEAVELVYRGRYGIAISGEASRRGTQENACHPRHRTFRLGSLRHALRQGPASAEALDSAKILDENKVTGPLF
jgi:hypothetical protein